jgi:hypothetical protein
MRQRRMPYDLALQAVEKLFGVHLALHPSQVPQFIAPEHTARTSRRNAIPDWFH